MSNTRKNIFELMALKEKIGITRKMKNVSLLREELGRTTDLKGQLGEAVTATKTPDGEQTAGQLRANSWYLTQILDQLDTIENRETFLSKEVKDEEMAIAKSRQKRDKSLEKSAEIYLHQANIREEKIAAQLSGARRNPNR
ncbi:insulinase family protein [Alphaproteobacteria bacterium]|jgi:hypothetical protein|nr:insulinase family protein [Alphaproteobacteria bacterium]